MQKVMPEVKENNLAPISPTIMRVGNAHLCSMQKYPVFNPNPFPWSITESTSSPAMDYYQKTPDTYETYSCLKERTLIWNGF